MFGLLAALKLVDWIVSGDDRTLLYRVRFIEFIDQSTLPQVYCGSDLLVLPSEYEPFGLVVNEAMLCGRGVIVSDRVGAKFDLIREGETGFVYPCGDIETLAKLLQDTLSDRDALQRYGEAARQRMTEWSPQAYVDSFVEGVRRALNLHDSARHRNRPVSET
ncbi:MAG: glycosyltransferase [Candidatus Acidiferrales bacterium]